MLSSAAVRGLRYAPAVKGGAMRQVFVHAGLEALAATRPDIVLVSLRRPPLRLPAALISRHRCSLGHLGAAVPAISVADTIKLVDSNGRIEATPERARLRIAETPH